MLQTIITLAHNLGVDVTAEGVETLQQLNLLRDLGCQLGQGYLFSRPIDSEMAGVLLNHEFRYLQG